MDNGYYKLPPGKIANAVTWLELTDLSERQTPDPGLTLRKLTAKDSALHRQLYRMIGEDWLWSGLLGKADTEIKAYLSDPTHLSFIAFAGEKPVGMLDLIVGPEGVEINYFGLVEAQMGKGAGRWLMGQAIRITRETGLKRLWLHTCNFDHPGAVSFYQRQGFRIDAQGFEIMDDPRHKGLLPVTAAKHVPFMAG